MAQKNFIVFQDALSSKWEAPGMTVLPIRLTASNPGNSADAAVPVRPGFNMTDVPKAELEIAQPVQQSAKASRPEKGWEIPELKRVPISNL